MSTEKRISALKKSCEKVKKDTLELATTVADMVKHIGMPEACRLAAQSWACTEGDIQLLLEVAEGARDPFDTAVVDLVIKMQSVENLRRN